MKRILLVDDEEIANYLHGLIVRKLGVFDQVDICDSAADALALLKSLELSGAAAPDMILLDINMPIMNGYQFLDEYQKLGVSFRENTKVVMLSSSLSEKDRLRALEYSCVNDFSSKPLTADSLTALVAKHSMQNT